MCRVRRPARSLGLPALHSTVVPGLQTHHGQPVSTAEATAVHVCVCVCVCADGWMDGCKCVQQVGFILYLIRYHWPGHHHPGLTRYPAAAASIAGCPDWSARPVHAAAAAACAGACPTALVQQQQQYQQQHAAFFSPKKEHKACRDVSTLSHCSALSRERIEKVHHTCSRWLSTHAILADSAGKQRSTSRSSTTADISLPSLAVGSRAPAAPAAGGVGAPAASSLLPSAALFRLAPGNSARLLHRLSRLVGSASISDCSSSDRCGDSSSS